MKFNILLIVFCILFIGLTLAQNTSLDCQYKELKKTDEFVQVLYDIQGNAYQNPIEIKNIVGAQERVSFDLKNKIPFNLSIKVNYDVSHPGGGFYPQEESYNIGSLETRTVVNTVTSGIRWGNSSVDNIRITYLFNEELDVRIEKIKEEVEVCKLCNGKICLNDGAKCNVNVECGSDICNIAGYCGVQKVIDCLDGLQNCNNQSCLEPKIKEKGESYSCDFECKSEYGKEGVCVMSLKERIFKNIFLILSVIVLIIVIYIIWTEKSILNFFRGHRN